VAECPEVAEAETAAGEAAAGEGVAGEGAGGEGGGGGEPGGGQGDGGGSGRYSGRYADGQKAYRTNVPRNPDTNIPEPDPAATGPHSRLQPDAQDSSRTYSATEFDAEGNPVKRIDFAGRKGDPLPHEHPYNPATKGFGDKQPLNTGPDPTDE